MRRANEALQSGIRTMVVYRYSRARGISPAAPLPNALFQKSEARTFNSIEFELWESLPQDIGPFFVDFLIGATGPFSGVDSALAQPPTTTMEFFRPRWYEKPEVWELKPLPSDFADSLLDSPPALTDLGGLFPWLAQWFLIESAKSLAGRWAGDRWAVWIFSGEDDALRS